MVWWAEGGVSKTMRRDNAASDGCNHSFERPREHKASVTILKSERGSSLSLPLSHQLPGIRINVMRRAIPDLWVTAYSAMSAVETACLL